eukprot:SAG31_NODE_876_length_11307_cov_3.506781_1_plen_273_part_00
MSPCRAYTGTHLLWVLLAATAMGLALQLLAARLGVVTGVDLATTCRAEYPRWTAHGLWLMTEIAIIGSDVQEIVGTAIGFQILLGLPLWLGSLLTAFDTAIFLGLQQLGIRRLEAFIFGLLATMAGCFTVNLFAAHPSTATVLAGVTKPLPLPAHGLQIAVGAIGAAIMPHNIYLHSALVLSRPVDREESGAVREAYMYFALEAGLALAFSFLINFAVVAAFSSKFYHPQCASLGAGPYAALPVGSESSTCDVFVKVRNTASEIQLPAGTAI